MANKIVLNMDMLSSFSVQLENVQNQMEQLTCSLTGLDIEKKSGGELGVEQTLQLISSGESISGRTVAELVKAYGKGLSATGEKVQMLARNLKTVQHVFEQLEKELADLTQSNAEDDKRGSVAILTDTNVNGSVLDTSKVQFKSIQMSSMVTGMTADQRNLADAWLRRIQNARKPEQAISALNLDDLNIANHISSFIWALISGKFDQMWQNSDQKQKYLFANALDCLEGGNVQLLNMEGIPGEADSIIKCMQFINENMDLDASSIELLDKISKVTGTVEALVDTYNKMQIVSAMDEGRLNSLIDIYMKADDPDMNKVGAQLKALAQADTETRIKMVRDGAISDVLWDTVQGAAVGVIESVGEGNAVVQAITITRDTVDALMNSSDIPQLQNETAYAMDAAKATYDVMQQYAAEYKANPTVENCNKMIRAYEQYNLEMANAEEAMVDWARASDDSVIGQLLDSKQREQVINRAQENADYFRSSANNARDHSNRHFS